MKDIHLVNLGLAGVLVGGSVVAYPHLPHEIPGHFDLAGQATYWTDASFWRWMLGPLLGAAIYAMNYFLAYRFPKESRWWNIPYKDDILALPEHLREEVFQEVNRMLFVMGAAILVKLIGIQWGKFQTAVAGGDGFSLMTTFVLIGGFLFLMFYPIAWLVRFSRLVKEIKARHEEESDAGVVG